MLKRIINNLRHNAWHVNMFLFYIVVLMAWGLYVLYSAVGLMKEEDYWVGISKQFTRENITIPATRGAIIDCNGQMLSASVPEYRLYLDYRVISNNEKARNRMQHLRDSLYGRYVDSLAIGLASIFQDRDAKWFRKRLDEGLANYHSRLVNKKEPGSCTWLIYKGLANHIQYKQCLQLPFFREGAVKSGFHGEPVVKRIRPYGDLCSRTIGTLYPESDQAKCGMELCYDSILRGTNGVAHSVRMRNKQITLTDEPPVNGHDIMTTIDINLQDYADKVLRSKLMEETVNGDIGVAIVMETKTGDIKAMVNLMRATDGRYYEMKNHAVSDLMEPGSTFKTASIMVAMEDGYITEHSTVDCMGGICNLHGRFMRDHDLNRGGHGVITVSEVLEQSSNVGVSRIIDEHYGDNPQRFVDGLYREGVGVPLDLPFVGKGEPIVPSPSSKIRYWSKTDLPWMSIGYVTLIPPISTLTFYNAIANNGVMVRPRFLKAELNGGQVVKEYPVEVINPKIASDNTLRQIQHCLNNVVSKGLGSKAGNGGKLFQVSGKTGTARFAENGSYSSLKYMVSFCGYFPSEAPRYSCIVCIVKKGLPASGGGQCGPVFREISEFVMGHSDYKPVVAGRNKYYEGAEKSRDARLNQTVPPAVMPNVVGLGADDAVYLLQQCGLKAKISGGGKVTHQSIPSGQAVRPGQQVSLTLH